MVPQHKEEYTMMKVEHKGKPTIKHQSSIQDQILHFGETSNFNTAALSGNPGSLHRAIIRVKFEVRLLWEVLFQSD
jgi:hypothetical protein